MNLFRAPLRISYVGGGTDYPDFYLHHEGAGSIAAAIDQFVYLYSHSLSDVADESIRFTYRETESVENLIELKHPLMREMLISAGWKDRTNFGTFADLPSGVGLGGSSSFAVALANLIFVKKGLDLNPQRLAEYAIHIEREVLNEPGGIQDQYIAAFGGLRRYSFGKNGTEVSKQLLEGESLSYLEERQMLIWLGKTRDSADHAGYTKSSIKRSSRYLLETANLLNSTSQEIASSLQPIEYFNSLRKAVFQGWQLKKEFTSELDPSVIEIEKIAQSFPDVALKLCGAGGSGFILLLGEPDTLESLKALLSSKKFIQPKIEKRGSIQISFSQMN
jgi:D-glycero-alpha-D-manno-heptose-7-phosphate kinase